MEVKCDNMVFNGDLGAPLSLLHLVENFPFFNYINAQYPPAVGHFDHPRVTISVFSTGRITIVGCKNEFAAYYAANLLVELLRPVFPAVSVGMLRLIQVTRGLDLGCKLDLAACTADNPETCIYIPESFPCMRVRTGVGKIRHNVSANGKIGAPGAVCDEDAIESLRRWVPVYLQYACR